MLHVTTPYLHHHFQRGQVLNGELDGDGFTKIGTTKNFGMANKDQQKNGIAIC
jgi:hypothetical protein